jgi:hypothetical protein
MLSRKFIVTMVSITLLCITAWGAVSAATSFTLEYDLSKDDTPVLEFVPATVTGSGVKGFNLTRGPGINPKDLVYGFSANTWNGAVSLADAIAIGKYFQWGFTTEATVSLQTLDIYLRRSAATSPMNIEMPLTYISCLISGIAHNLRNELLTERNGIVISQHTVGMSILARHY